MGPVQRLRAPELRGRGGLAGDAPPSLASLRGRVVLLGFWTSSSVTCLHVLDELRALEQRFGDDLVVVGVHSPRLAHERDQAHVATCGPRPSPATWSAM